MFKSGDGVSLGTVRVNVGMFLKLTIIIIYVVLHIRNDWPARNRQAGNFHLFCGFFKGIRKLAFILVALKSQKCDCRYGPHCHHGMVEGTEISDN